MSKPTPQPSLLFGKGSIGGVEHFSSKMDTAARNFHQSKSYVAKEQTALTDRDWRLFREDNLISVKGGKCPPPIRNWTDIPDMPKDLVKNLQELRFEKPMPIQMQAVPIGLNMRDMIALAPTGSGKSAAFLIPLIIFLLKQPPIRDHLI